VMAQIAGEGFEMLLFLNATIAIFGGDGQDVEFLKSMRISLKK